MSHRRLLPSLAVWFLLAAAAWAAGPRALPAGKLPEDSRLGPLRGEEGNFPLTVPKHETDWQTRKREIRRGMLVSLGLWPLPTRNPLEPVIHGKRDLGDYTVEKVYFQSVPGFYVTGSLYRPKQANGKRPGVLSPHGHFPGGRFQDAGRNAVRRSIAAGAERFEEGGRSFMQSRAVQLARMGCVVFHYDMIGYGDSQQLAQEHVHQFRRSRNAHQAAPKSGLYSAAAESRLHNVLGLHTWNSIRALDFLTGLPDVDGERIAVTGGSGGGTQTFMLCAVDDRPLVSVPVVIVSTTRQGGCTCENICNFRIDANNIEFTALHAPKPLLLISADDATRTMPQRGFPELQQLYRLLGQPEHVSHAALLHFPHNYNYVSRTAMYHWLNRHLKLELEEPILERPYKLLSKDDLTVWDDQHPRPESGPRLEQKLLDWLSRDADKQIAAAQSRDQKPLLSFNPLAWNAFEELLRFGFPQEATLKFTAAGNTPRDGYRETVGLLRYETKDRHRAELPVVALEPDDARRTVIWISPRGKAGLYEANGSLRAPVRKLLAAKARVVGADLLYQGESLSDGKPPRRNRWLDGEQGFAGWTYCYNLSTFAWRVQDISAVLAWHVRLHAGNDEPVDLLAEAGAGHWAAAALAGEPKFAGRAAIDTAGFRFAKLTDVYDIDFVPGAVKYGDLPGLLSLTAPRKLLLGGEGDQPPAVVSAAFQAWNAERKLHLSTVRPDDFAASAVDWLLKD